MKILVENYTFDASEKKITFTDYTPVVLERVLVITNVTDGIIIYNFADPTKLGTVATNVLTLAYNTTTMDDTDKLQIFYDDNATTQPISGTVTSNLSATDNAVLDAIVANQVVLESLVETLQELTVRLAPLAGAVAMVGGQALRTQGVGTFAVSGPQTSAQFIASHTLAGVNYPEKVALTNMAAQANINNCIGG